jgi:tetratricopeptide (TPR) repeat protein
LLVVALAAIAIRVGYLIALRQSPFFAVPVVDAETYVTMARAIAAGDWAGGRTVYWQPPLYPYLLALGFGLGLGPLGARLVQFGVGVATAALLAHLGRRLGGARVGLLAGLGAALYGPALFFEGRFLATTLILSLNVVSLALFVWALARGGLWRRMIAGGSFGLATLARPDAFLTVLLLAVGMLWIDLRSGREPDAPEARQTRQARLVRQPGLLALGFLLSALLVTLPVTLRNRWVAGEWVWVSSNGGLNYFIGNNPEAARTIAIHPGRAWEALVETPHREAGLTRAVDRSRYFYRQALHFAQKEPGSFLFLQSRKLWQFFAGYEIPREEDLYFVRRESPLYAALTWRLGTFGFPFGLVSPLAILGAIVLWSRRRELAPLYLAGLGATVAVVAFFVTGRYRLPALPIFLVFAALAVDWLLTHGRDAARRQRFLLAWAGLAVGAAALPAGSRPDSEAEQWRLLAIAEFEQGAFKAAVEHQALAAGLDPKRPELQYDLGVYRAALGDTAGAITAYQRAIALDPSYGEPRVNLGLLLARAGDYPSAVNQILTAAATNPNLAPAQLAAGHAFYHSGAIDSALARYRRAVAVDPQSLEARLAEVTALDRLERSADAIAALRQAMAVQGERPELLAAFGRELKSAGRYPEAIAALRAALASGPPDAEIHVTLGQCYRALGRLTEAEAEQKQALALDPKLVPAHVNLADVYARRGLYDQAINELERALRLEPFNTAAIYNLAVVHANLGQEAEAVLLLEKLMALDPKHEAGRHALARLKGEPEPH